MQPLIFGLKFDYQNGFPVYCDTPWNGLQFRMKFENIKKRNFSGKNKARRRKIKVIH